MNRVAFEDEDLIYLFIYLFIYCSFSINIYQLNFSQVLIKNECISLHFPQNNLRLQVERPFFLACDFLDETFPDPADRKGWDSILVSKLSSITHLYFFFFGGYMKDRVFSIRVLVIEELKARI